MSNLDSIRDALLYARLAISESVKDRMYQFYLKVDKLPVNILSVEQARKLYEAFGQLLVQVEEE